MFKEDLNKKQLITIICLLIVVSGIFGWIYEVLFYYLNSGFKTIYLRGRNFLPWINIYMYGSFLILLLAYKRKKHPIQVFLISAVSTGILEYLTGYILYGKLGWTKYWDYNKEILNFGNIDGYICLRSILVFAICGLILVYLIIPTLLRIVKSKNIKIIFIISIVLCSVILIDEVYNLCLYKLFNLPSAVDIYKNLGFKYLIYN